MRQPDLRGEHATLLLTKASEDEALLDLVLLSEQASDSIVGFHCQQAAEKLVKALLAARGVAYRRTHDLDELFALVGSTGADVPDPLLEAARFTAFAVTSRYEPWPTDEPPLDRRAARSLLAALRRWVEREVEDALGGPTRGHERP
jgi:HEPN domain-containing protein